MKPNNYRYILPIVAASLFFTACGSKLTISGVDFSQQIESVVVPKSNGVVEDPRTGISFNINPLQFNETKDTTRVSAPEVRFIRNHEGYYFVTAPGFKNVYVMKTTDKQLILHKALLVTENGIEQPALNQRKPYIQLLDGDRRTYNLTKDSVQ